MARFNDKICRTPAAIVGFCLIQALMLTPSLWLPLGNRDAVGAGFREVFARCWLSAELVLGILLLMVVSSNKQRWLRRVLALGLSLCFVLEVYEVFILRAFSRMPVLYNDMLLVWDALNLAFDLLTGGIITTVVLMVVGSALLFFVNLKALGGIADWILVQRRLPVKRVVSIALVFVCLVMLERSPAQRDAVIQSPVVRLQANLVRSWSMREAMLELANQPSVPSVAQRLVDVELEQTPDIYLLVVESYGAIVFEHDGLAPGHVQQMREMESRLSAAGFRAQTNLSISPVIGGASWQATSTLLSGIPITNQHIYTKLSGAGAYGLPEFLGTHGYTTWTVQAGYRTRPGRPVSNPWGYNHTLYFEDLKYEGRRWGWGVVPDQYALGFARERLREAEQSPRFMAFTGVSTHVPWSERPGFMKEWEALGQPFSGELDGARLWGKMKSRLLGDSASCITLACFQDAINYEWQVLMDFVERIESPAAIVVIVGDHQPPVLPTQGAAVPLHVLSRGVKGMEQLTGLGFEPGLVPGESETINHEGVFSMLAHLLASPDGDGFSSGIYRKRGDSAAALLSTP